MESFDFIQWSLDNLNYWTITLLMAIESSFIPFPSEVVVPPAGYKAAAGELNIFAVVFFSTLGALIGALVNYGLSYWLGRPIIYRFVNSKFGHACMLSQEKLENAEKYFLEHGVSSTLLGRLVPAVRQLISIPAGLSKMNLTKFMIFTFLGAGIWNSVLTAIGYVLHYFVPMNELSGKIAEYKPYLTLFGVIVFILFVAYLLYVSKKKKKQTNEE